MRTHWRERRLHTFASPSDVLSTVRSSSDRQTERTSWRWPSPTSAAVSTAAPPRRRSHDHARIALLRSATSSATSLLPELFAAGRKANECSLCVPFTVERG